MNAPQTIISRADAAALHSKTFFTGKPCKRGHLAKRYVSTGNCTECSKAAAYAFNDKLRGKASAPVHSVPVSFHPDDAEAVFALVDYLNAQRGLGPTPRPKVLPSAPVVDPRTPWERAYDLHRGRSHTHDMAHRLASMNNPETHSPGWTGAAAVVAIDPARQELLGELQAPTYGGGAMPDYLK